MGIKVAKFGGSSLSDAEHFKKVFNIIKSDPSIAYIVPSAPGKRYEKDTKITDLLYLWEEKAINQKDYSSEIKQIKYRYMGIAKELNLDIDIHKYFDQCQQEIDKKIGSEYVASRGEHLSGLLLAKYLDIPFIDSAKVIRFDETGKLDEDLTNELLRSFLKNKPTAVIPGFYGAQIDGKIRTFSRGGSDITGALISRAVQAETYENWTDVCGFLLADPREVPAPVGINHITYQELRELSYMGANVLHEDAIFPVHRAGIPINIRNTNQPKHPGTWIEYKTKAKDRCYTITGLAGKKGFCIITVEKTMMNSELGFGRRVLEELENKRIPFDHVTTGIDTMCVVVEEKYLRQIKGNLRENILSATKADSVTIKNNIALVATVGWGMVGNPGTAAKLFAALGDADINIKMIDQGSSELSIITAVEEEDMTRAINVIYNAFVA